MFSDGIYQIGDGLLDIEEEHLKGLLVQDDINEIYDVEQTPFARGKFAAVRRAIHKNSGVHFAAKFLKRRRRAQSSDKEIKHEIAVLMLCSGAENIVKLNAVHESRSDTALLLELATGGELQTFLDNEECLSEAQARICMREVLKALQFLHNRSIAHLDLKPQNILLTGERIEDGLKLCDFGISRVVADGSNVREIVGTPDYVAPEVLQYEPLSLQTDIWSVGVLTYVLLSGFSPFGGDTKQETFLNISQCALTFPDKLFNGISSQAIDFMRRALRIKPNDRMTAPGCLEHIWLKDECSIDRQIFNNISKATAVEKENGKTIDNEDDGEDDYDNDDADDDDGAVDERNSKQNGFNQYRMNGKMHYNGSSSGNHSSSLSTTKATSGNNVSHRSTTNGGGNCQQTKVMTTNGTSRFSVNGKSTTTMISAAATRATTTPITMQTSNNSHNNSKIGGSLLVAPRRHSSDSNKENHNFLTKKYQMATSTNGAIVIGGGATATKKTITSTSSTMVMNVGAINGLSTSTSCIVTIPLSTSIVVNDVGGTVAVANGINDKSAANSICLFPDAPTTPKVIRKAPTSDTSPTSVKALVKKFQLENRNNGGIATATTNDVSSPPPLQSSSSSSYTSSAFSSSMLLKEAQHNNHQRILHHQQEQHQQHKHLSPSQSNGNSSRKLSTGMKSSGADKNNSQGSCNLLNKKYSNIHQHSHNSNNSSSSRRLSSAYYKNSTTNNKSPSSSQEDITSASGTNSHQKLIASHSNPTSMTSCSSSSVCPNTSNSLPPSSTSAAATSASSSSTYKSTCVFCMTCSGPGCRHSGSTSAAAAIMINQKSAVQNSISLDKGIIC